MKLMTSNSVGVVILNWRNANDTIECLDSLFKVQWDALRIVVCDNNSGDGSFEEIGGWLKVRLPDSQWTSLQYHAERFSAVGGRPSCEKLVTLISNDTNLGFAGGNNVGIRYFQDAAVPPAYYWILNNDTVVDPYSIKSLVTRMEEDDSIGICGSRIIYADSPNYLQAHGGATHNRWIGTGRYIGHLSSADSEVKVEAIESKFDYICGAAMFVRSAFIEKVGLMSESYFLYFEELDWAVRGRSIFRLGYASDSKVFHKEGGTIGSSSNTRRTSWLSDYYLFLNRIRFTFAYYPYALPTVYCAMVLQAMRRLFRGQQDRCWLIFRLLLGWRKV